MCAGYFRERRPLHTSPAQLHALLPQDLLLYPTLSTPLLRPQVHIARHEPTAVVKALAAGTAAATATATAAAGSGQCRRHTVYLKQQQWQQ